MFADYCNKISYPISRALLRISTWTSCELSYYAFMVSAHLFDMIKAGHNYVCIYINNQSTYMLHNYMQSDKCLLYYCHILHLLVQGQA